MHPQFQRPHLLHKRVSLPLPPQPQQFVICFQKTGCLHSFSLILLHSSVLRKLFMFTHKGQQVCLPFCFTQSVSRKLFMLTGKGQRIIFQLLSSAAQQRKLKFGKHADYFFLSRPLRPCSSRPLCLPGLRSLIWTRPRDDQCRPEVVTSTTGIMFHQHISMTKPVMRLRR